jgi:hypothetical protein
MRFQIFVIGTHYSPAPNTYWASREMAEKCIPYYEKVKGLENRLEARESDFK